MSDAVVNRTIEAPAKWNRDDPTLRPALWCALFVAVGYYFTAKIGFAFTLQPGSVSILWMPNSILLAALLLTAKRWWWIVLLGALPAHLAAEWMGGVPTAMVLSWFVSNSAQALIGAFLVQKFIDGPLRFDSFRHLTVFILVGVLFATYTSSFLDIALVKLNGWGTASYWESWRVRFLSNTLATLTLTPAIVAWVQGGFRSWLTASLLRYAEAGALVAGLLVVDWFVFSSQASAANPPTQLYWPLPFLLWAAVRFGPQGTSTMLLLVMFTAIYGATHERGPFISQSSLENSLSLQWFLIVVSIPMMALAAVIAERKKAEVALRESEARQIRTAELSLVMSAHVGLDGRWLKVPPTLCELLGYTDAELLARTTQDVTHPDDIKASCSKVQRLLRGEIRSFDIEKRYLHRSGRPIWVYLNCSVVQEEDGQPICFQNYVKDITDYKLAQQALLESNERNRAILSAIPDLVFLNNRAGLYLDYHARDPARLLVPPEVFIGKHIRDVLPEELAEQFMTAIAQFDRTGKTQEISYALTIDGEERYFEARVVGAEGDKVLSIVRDVTESHRAAAALRLGEEKLVESNRQIHALAASILTAQESERRRISLLLHDDLSQDIAMMGLSISRLKRKQPLDPEHVIRELDLLGGRINDLTTQIRRLSHQLHPAALEHLGLVAALESEITEFSREEGIELTFSAAVSTEDIPFDVSVCLYRVALEAMRNVSKHSGARSAAVSLREAEGVLTLVISDSGSGFRLASARRGSGLGLISAEERIKLLQGTFEVNAKPEGGTEVVARIPIERST